MLSILANAKLDGCQRLMPRLNVFIALVIALTCVGCGKDSANNDVNWEEWAAQIEADASRIPEHLPEDIKQEMRQVREWIKEGDRLYEADGNKLNVTGKNGAYNLYRKVIDQHKTNSSMTFHVRSDLPRVFSRTFYAELAASNQMRIEFNDYNNNANLGSMTKPERDIFWDKGKKLHEDLEKMTATASDTAFTAFRTSVELSSSPDSKDPLPRSEEVMADAKNKADKGNLSEMEQMAKEAGIMLVDSEEGQEFLARNKRAAEEQKRVKEETPDWKKANYARNKALEEQVKADIKKMSPKEKQALLKKYKEAEKRRNMTTEERNLERLKKAFNQN